MSTAQKLKTALFSLLPYLLYSILAAICISLPLFFHGVQTNTLPVTLVYMAVCVAFGFLLFRKKKEISVKDFANLPTSDLLPVVMGAIFLYAIHQLMDLVFSLFVKTPSFELSDAGNLLEYLKASVPDYSIGGNSNQVLMLLLILPVVEGVLLRYFPLTLCKGFSSVPKLCIGSGILFGLLSFTSVRGLLSAFFLCTVLALIFLKTGSIWHSVLAHILFHATTLIPQMSIYYHTVGNTGFGGIVWAVLQLAILAVPIIWFILQGKEKQS